MTTGQNTSSRTKSLVLPQVRYHPSIRNRLDQNQNQNCVRDLQMEKETKHDSKTQRSTKSGTKNLPEVEYHPSISNPATQRHEDRVGPEGGARVQRPAASNAKKRAAGATRPGDGDRETRPKDRTTDRTEAENTTPAPANSERTNAKTQTKKTHKSKHLNPISVNNQESPSPGLDPVLPEPRPGSCLDQDLVDQVEVQTRGQSTNPDWFRFRKNRITASVAHSISNCGFITGKKTLPPESYVRTVLGESGRVQTRAMSWGVDHEKVAVLKYQEQQSAALGRPVSVQKCGLFIDRARPWLAASPDGIVTDERTGQWLRCLEVKCPFKHRACSVEQAVKDDRSFCLEARNHQGAPQFSLKRTHSYFTQVQVQLAVTGLKTADFVVWTLKDLVVVQVQFDPDFWAQTVSRLERFYSEAVIPALKKKSPVWKHEI